MNKKKLIIFFLIVGVVLVFWSSTFLQDYFQSATIYLENYGNSHQVLSILVFIGLTALSAMLMSFSSIWLVPVAVLIWSNSLTIFFLILSWLIGATISYLIGRYGGYPIVHKLISNKKILYYEKLIKNKLGFWIIFLFRLTLPSEIPGYVLGIVKYNFPKYLLITFLAELPYAIYSVYAFESIIEKDTNTFIVTAIIWFASVWLLAYLYMKKIKKKEGQILED